MPDGLDITAERELVPQIRDPRLRRLFEYWSARKGSRRFPVRRDIDPLDLKYLLGNIMLVDVLREPLRFRVRLHGDNMVLRAGYDLTGKMLADLPISDYRTYVIERCVGLVETKEPLVVQHDRLLDGRRERYEALWLPFSENGAEVTTLLCALVYDK